MKTPDLSNCRSVEEIRAEVAHCLESETVVRNAREARRFFKQAGIGGCVNARTFFRERREIPSICPLRRTILVYVDIQEYYIDPGSVDYVYSYDIITY